MVTPINILYMTFGAQKHTWLYKQVSSVTAPIGFLNITNQKTLASHTHLRFSHCEDFYRQSVLPHNHSNTYFLLERQEDLR